MVDRSHPREDAVELGEVQALTPEQFYLLYQGVLKADSRAEFYRSALVVLGMGRLGLAPSTLGHLHEGWIDWKAGSIEVPDHEACSCTACVERLRAETNLDDSRQIEVICQDRFWRPESGRGGRAIPFGWSRRLTGVLMESFDHFEYPEFEDGPVECLRRVAARSPGLEADAITPKAMRASAAQTFADLGLRDEQLADVLGVDPAAVRRFVRQAKNWGTPAPLRPTPGFRSRYRVVGNPEPFADEPCDPTAYDTDARDHRARRNAPTSDPVGNPRPPAPELDPDPAARAERADYLDPDSDLLSVEADSVESFVDAWVTRHDSRDDASVAAETGDGQRPAPAADSSPAAAVGDGGTTAVVDSGSERGTTAPRSPGDDGSGRDVPDGPEMVPDPLPEVVDSPVADFPARYVSTLMTGGDPVTGHVVVDTDRVAFDVRDAPVQEGAQSFVVPMHSVTDFSFDYGPDTTEEFGNGVALAVSWDATRETIAIEFDGADNEFAANLFAQLFDDRDAIVSYPVRQGGRVNEDVAASTATLHVEGGSIVATERAGDERIVEIDLAEVSTVDRQRQVHDGDSVPSVEVDFSVDGAAKTARIGFRGDDRLTRLLSVLAQVHYRHQRRKMGNMSLSNAEKECLVALHSLGGSAGGMDLSTMVDVGGDYEAFVAGLADKGVVEVTDDGPELTGIGRTVVTEKIDDVNF